mmetsp:Transcript_4748/g.9600  ORF Transcript_4748/g.9600 Transcript_4748/m.9600 type:complete len:120 (-) Transcript_4748:1856-2215(-)
MLVKEKAEMFLTGFVGNVHLFPVRVVVQRCCRVRRRSGTVEVTRTVVEKTAKLAQLDLVQGEVDVLTDDFVKILGFVESVRDELRGISTVVGLLTIIARVTPPIMMESVSDERTGPRWD